MYIATTGTVTIDPGLTATIRVNIPSDKSIKSLKLESSGPVNLGDHPLFIRGSVAVVTVTGPAGVVQLDITRLDGNLEFNISPAILGHNEGEFIFTATNPGLAGVYFQVWWIV